MIVVLCSNDEGLRIRTLGAPSGQRGFGGYRRCLARCRTQSHRAFDRTDDISVSTPQQPPRSTPGFSRTHRPIRVFIFAMFRSTSMNAFVFRTLVFAVALDFGGSWAFAEQLNQGSDGTVTSTPGDSGVATFVMNADLFRLQVPVVFSDFSELLIPVPNRSTAGGSADFAAAGQAATPEPSHSGWGSLVKETAKDFAAFPRRRSTWVILGAGAGAALLAHPADDYVTAHIVGSTSADRVFRAGKWLGSAYVQAGTAVGLYVVGRYLVPRAADGSRTNKVSHLGFDLIRVQILSQALVQGIKYSVRRDRPTGECCAFPSGHAASAFAVASVLERHFGYRGAWPTVVAASYVATSRLVDNRHFLSDVVFGSAVGIVSGWTVVGSHGRSTFSLVPTPVPGGVFLALARTPARAVR